MCDDSSDEDCGFELSSPSDYLVHQGACSLESEYVAMPGTSSSKGHNSVSSKDQIPPHPFVQKSMEKSTSTKAQMHPHPLMQKYGVSSKEPIQNPPSVRQMHSKQQVPAQERAPEHQSTIQSHPMATPSEQTSSSKQRNLQYNMHQQPSTSYNEFPSLSKERRGAKNPKKPKQGKSLSSEFHSAPRSHGNQTREINMEELKQKNPKVSEKWLKKTLQQNSPFEPSKSNMKKMLEYIEAKWFDESLKDKSHASTLMREYFARSCHPYALVLYFIENCHDHKSGKTTTLCFQLMKEFLTWQKHTHIVNQRELLTEDIKLRALQACTTYHTTLFNMAATVFQLNQTGNEYMIPQIKAFLEQKKYNEVRNASFFIGGGGTVSSKPCSWRGVLIKLYVKKFVSDLRQVGGFLWVLRF